MSLNPFAGRLLKNFVSLGVLQVANFVIPLITTPYVIRKIGIENYGSVNVALGIMIFFNTLVDYGFNLSATRDVSINRNNTEALGRITSRVLVCKFILFGISLVLLSIIVWSVPSLRSEWDLFYLSSVMILSQTILPSWFYQGIEKMKYITYLTISGKLISLALIFVLIRDKPDYIYINAITGITTLIPSLYGFYLAYRNNNLTFSFPGKSEIWAEYKSGFLIFMSSLSFNVYSFSNVLILNFVTNDKSLVGSYSIAEKVIIIIRQILGVYTQVIYPHLCSLLIKGYEEIKTTLKRIFLPFLALILIGSILLWFLAPWIVFFLSGSFDKNAIFLLRLLSPLPLIVTLNIPFYQILLIYDFKKIYSSIFIVVAIVSLPANFILTYLFGTIGTSSAVLLAEMAITFSLYMAFRRSLKQILSRKVNPIVVENEFKDIS